MPSELITAAGIDRLRLLDIWPVRDPLELTLAEQTGLATDAPVLLLPVGLSARFSPDRMHLRVRIQPDAVHVDNHHYTLTTEEQRLGAEFWEGAATDRPAAWHRLVTSRRHVAARRQPGDVDRPHDRSVRARCTGRRARPALHGDA